MKIYRSAAMILSVILLAGSAAFAQAQPDGKVGLISIERLGGEGGITKYINALNTLNKEFETETKELQGLATTINTKREELQKLAQQAQQPNSPVSNESLRTKNDEIETLRRQAEYKQKDVQARFQSRQQTVVGPVFAEIMKALQDYTVQKGYSMILDGAKLEESAILLTLDTKYDVTKDFITYFNSRPASSAPASQ
ncbi:MAG: OmpH family outer membrane protein [Acidobacteria bacterium]|nr:MAG: OmpH family outer membrane protein [Acidobacteriota bacterium]REJ98716.1 MAG: OmpH family outer membrane protein [Acidobacteriota bacterium]REK16629.1 MAG: OmpH family outer membrane protein [Acidobacteriota bacterium]REK42540.1 MAG: OmpH family outer membrane protein [Acidobacteriota bacterium]